MVIIDVIYSFLVCFQTEIRYGIAEGPDFNCVIQTCRCERLWIFRVDSKGHDVMCMSFKDLQVSHWVLSCQNEKGKAKHIPEHISMLYPNPNI